MRKLICFVFLFHLFAHARADELKPLPLVMWHGMGDSCCNPNTMGYFKSLIEENVDGIYVHSIQIGNNMFEVSNIMNIM